MIHTFRASDCPDAGGRRPQPGEQKWTLRFPLEGGDDYLEVEIGAKGRAAIKAMLAREEKDDSNPAGPCRYCGSNCTAVAEDGWKVCGDCHGRWWK